MNNRTVKRIVLTSALAAILLVSLGFSACSKKEGGEGVLIVGLRASPVTLDPRIATDAVGDKISQLICDGLFVKNDNLEMVPNLAESYEQVTDKSYRFKLRKGVKFHDGNEFNADDVVYTFQTIIDGTVASAHKNAFGRIDKMVVEDPYTLRIDLKEPYAPFLTMLSRGIVSMESAMKLGDDFATSPVCAGPYRFVNYVTDSVVELEANDGYFGKMPKVKRLEFQIVKDDNIRVLKLIKGDVDLVQNDIPPLLLDSVLEKKGLEMKKGTGITMAYFGLNLDDPILSNKKVREAIAYAIDRDEIIKHKWKGLADKANSILAPDNWAYDGRLKQYSYDPAKAAKLLDEAGYPLKDGKRFTLALKTSTAKDRVEILQMIAHQLAKVGIEATVEPYEWGTFYKDVQDGNFQAYTLSWVGVTEPDIFYDIGHSTQMPPNGLNRDRFKSGVVDDLVEQGRVTMDPAKRKEIYAKVQEIFIDELPLIPLWYEKNYVVYRDGLKAVRLRPDANYITFLDVEKK